MNTQANPKPVMISFQRKVDELRLMGLVAWGGLCLDLDGLRARDMAARLGASRLWIETVFETMARSGSKALVLVDPDFSVFLGEETALRDQLKAWAERQGVKITTMHTRALALQAA